ncbi:MAG: ribbon-helix-helix protein, CopG family [Betaproteobacteria bacterium]|nr:ribbon-helix-helix protein, CopG family [Betaproteobacteria bacterium]
MSTTTIRLPEDLKARVSRAAQESGVSTHSFILQAIAEKTQQEESRTAFDALAEGRYARLLATGQTVPWQEMRAWLLERAEAAREQAAAPGAD